MKTRQEKFCCVLCLQICTVMHCFHWQMTQEMATASMRGAYCNTLPTTSQTGAGSTGFISIVPPAKLFNPPYCPFYLVFCCLVPIQLLPRYYCVVELKQLFPAVVYHWQLLVCFQNFCCCLVSGKKGVCLWWKVQSRQSFWWLQCVCTSFLAQCMTDTRATRYKENMQQYYLQ